MEVTEASQKTISVEDSSHVGEARRAAQALARQCGLSEIAAGNAAIVASELATNLFRYAPGGLIALQWLSEIDQGKLEILAVDNGPGMQDLPACMRDGYSSGGTAGNGLGAVKRLSAEFDIFSRPGQGTIVVSRIAEAARRAASSPNPLRWAVRAFPIRGETVNGDAWSIAEGEKGAVFIVVDGLGHGPLAADASDKIIEAFDSDPWLAPTKLIDVAHRAANGTRGAAMAVTSVDWTTMQVTYAGVGNISGALISTEGTTGMVSHNGIVGVQMRRPQHFSYSWPDSGILVMHSDGLQSRWSLDRYPGLREHHPAIVAALLARDFSRGRDDVTVLVAKR